jgi:transmembrane sensor
MSWLPGSEGRIRREAASWVARCRGNPAECDEQEFQGWYCRSDKHAAAYDRMSAIWDASGQVLLLSASAPSRNGGSNYFPSRRMALAASLVAVIVLAAGAFFQSRTDAEPRPILLASAVGEIVPYILSDGSRIVLDTQSKVAIEISKHERRLSLLSGRARFIVARDPRPFTVFAAGRQIVATGTTFDVSVIDADPAVHLLEGSLEVRGRGWTQGRPVARLRAGDDVVLVSSGGPLGRETNRTGASWTNYMLEFETTPLREAVALANRYSQTQIRLKDPALGSRQISGAFHVGDAEAFARSLAVAFGFATARAADGTIVLSDPRRSRA